MQVQPITSQPNFNGKVRCMNCIGIQDGFIKLPEKVAKNRVIDLPSSLWSRLNAIVKDEPFDVFIHPNLKNEEFFNVDAGETFSDVQKGMQGKVKVKYDALEALPLAVKDAIANFKANIKEKNFKILNNTGD